MCGRARCFARVMDESPSRACWNTAGRIGKTLQHFCYWKILHTMEAATVGYCLLFEDTAYNGSNYSGILLII